MMNTSTHAHIFDELAELARTLGHAHRLVLLDHITQGERAVERLAELSGLSIANASQHLQHLKRAGFVQTRRDGKRVLYRLGSGPTESVLAALRQFAEYNRLQIRELIIDSVMQPDRLEAISRAELVILMQENSITLLDVRPEEEYVLGHLPGAMNIPVGELARRLADLPADKEIIAYCRGPHCVLSAEAVTALLANGLSARRFTDGLPGWKAAGLDIEGMNYESG
jgi:rhodanese-related sulfurtransferase/DNA-binding MarR family transcriptional regulator